MRRGGRKADRRGVRSKLGLRGRRRHRSHRRSNAIFPAKVVSRRPRTREALSASVRLDFGRCFQAPISHKDVATENIISSQPNFSFGGAGRKLSLNSFQPSDDRLQRAGSADFHIFPDHVRVPFREPKRVLLGTEDATPRWLTRGSPQEPGRAYRGAASNFWSSLDSFRR